MTNADTDKKAALKASMRDMIKKKKDQISAAETKKAEDKKAALRASMKKAMESKKIAKKVEDDDVNVPRRISPVKDDSTQKRVDKLYKDWDKIVDEELSEGEYDDDFDSSQLEELNKVYMAAEQDFYKEMRNFDKIEKEDGWSDLVKQDKESADTFHHPHKQRLTDKLPDRTVTGHANPQKTQQQAIIKKQDAAYKNFCKGFLKGAEAPKPRKHVPKKVDDKLFRTSKC